jgi:hypothetical protein
MRFQLKQIPSGKWALFLSIILAISTWGTGPGVQPSSAPFSSGAIKYRDPNVPESQEEGYIDPRVQNDNEFEHCDNECMYHQANENISLQLEFILKKLQLLEELQKKIDDKNSDMDEKNEAKASMLDLLGSFCRFKNKETVDPETNKSVKAESGPECFQRWKKVNEFWILKARTALGKNNSSAAQFNGGGVVCQGDDCKMAPSNATAVQRGSISNTQPNSPEGPGGSTSVPQKFGQGAYFMKAQELAKQKGSSLLGNVKDSRGWEDFITTQMEPQHDDFIKFKTIQRDPNNPSMGTLEVPVLGPDGKPAYDDQAYEKAHKAWAQVFKAEKVLSETTKDGFPVAGSLQTQRFKEEFKKDPKATDKSLQRQIYDQVRDEYVDWINNEQKKKATQSQNQQQKTVTPQPNAAPTPGEVYYGDKNIEYKKRETVQEGGFSVEHSNSYWSSYHASQITFTPNPRPQPPKGSSGLTPVSGGTAPQSNQNPSLNNIQDPGDIHELDFDSMIPTTPTQ